jgi:hypothetical protein
MTWSLHTPRYHLPLSHPPRSSLAPPPHALGRLAPPLAKWRRRSSSGACLCLARGLFVHCTLFQFHQSTLSFINVKLTIYNKFCQSHSIQSGHIKRKPAKFHRYYYIQREIRTQVIWTTAEIVGAKAFAFGVSVPVPAITHADMPFPGCCSATLTSQRALQE